MKLTVFMHDERVDAITMDKLLNVIAIDDEGNETNSSRFFPFSILHKYLTDPKYTYLVFTDGEQRQLFVEKSKIAALMVD